MSKIAVIAEGPKTLWNLEKKWWCDFFSAKAFIRVRQSPAEREKKCEDDADGGSAAKMKRTVLSASDGKTSYT